MKVIVHCTAVEQNERYSYVDSGDAEAMVYETVKLRISDAPWAEDYEMGYLTIHISKPDMLGMFKVGCDYEVDVATTALPKDPKP